VLSSKDIKNLALQGRDVTELIKTLPGFNNTTGAGGLGNYGGYDPTITSIGSSVGNGYGANGTPNRTGTALTSDGANVIDVGCNCNATMTINADMVQEVKVSTSAFGADSAKGPVVIQAVGKSGSSEYHGGAYLHFRDSSMNSTDWINGNSGVAKPKDRYWYPGGNIGGPVPFTNKKAVFWAGYENYRQTFPDQVSHGVVRSVVPTMAMRAGNFDPNNPENLAFCSKITGWAPQCGGDAAVRDANGNAVLGPDGKAIMQHYGLIANAWNNTTQQMEDYGNAINVNGQLISVPNGNMSQYIDPGGAAIMKEIVAPNFVPTADNPYNFVKGVMSSDNGYMFHSRVDYNFSESTKLYVSYNQQRDDSGIPVMLWWLPPNSQTFPGGFVAGGNSKTISGNLVKVFSPTLTNEFITTFSYLNNTKSYSNPDGVSRDALGYPYKGIFGASKFMPMLSTGWWIPGYPMIYQADADGYFAKKVTPTFTDNLTKVMRTHTLKAGINWEKASNKELIFNEQNGNYQFGTWGASSNPVANILLAVPTSYEESSPNTTSNLGYASFGGYLQDDWKVSKRLTVNFGMRLSHDPAWRDTSGKTGLATWTASNYAADIAVNKTTLPGMRWNSIDSTVASSGRTTSPVFVSPRFGMSLDMFGNGKTVLRGGWGAYYYHDSIDGYAGAQSTAVGSRKCAVYAPTWLGDIDKGTNVSCAAVLGSYAVDPTDKKQSVTHTYNFTISQSMPGNSLLEVAYSGNETTDMINPLQNRNVIPLGAFFGTNPVTHKVETIHDIESGKRVDASGTTTLTKDQYRPMQQYGPLYVITHGAWANYNSLQVSWNKPRGAFTYGVNYVWSKAMGINGQNNFQPDPVNIHNDYGILNLDRTHVFNATYSYEVSTRFKGIVGGAINGWMISGITSIQSGAPMAQSGSINYGISGTSGAGYPNFYLDSTALLGSSDYSLMPTVSCQPGTSGGGFDTGCFGVPTKGTNGMYQSPYVHGPYYWNSDLRMAKTFKITESQNVQFSIAGFNFLNHPLSSFDPNDSRNRTLSYRPATAGLADYTNYAGPYTLSATGVGRPTIKYGRRVVELSLKYSF
jgi:hypothetical protein